MVRKLTLKSVLNFSCTRSVKKKKSRGYRKPGRLFSTNMFLRIAKRKEIKFILLSKE